MCCKNCHFSSKSDMGDVVPVTTEDAKPLFAAIQTRFGGNDATKKTQKTLLKQSYENFNASSTESLDSIFNRLQKIVSQSAILGENISQEDLNLKSLEKSCLLNEHSCCSMEKLNQSCGKQ
ncbi:hypothetical protein Tco_1252984 [Tanacetum coccineum]